MKREDIKAILAKDAQIIDFSDLSKSNDGKLKIMHANEFKSVCIDSLILKTGTEKIFVFLSAIGITRKEVLFHRVWWSNVFNGICIFIDDPRRHELEWSPTYYFGSKDDDYTVRIKELIQKLKDIYGIENKNICIISSSNGGFAAIRLSLLLEGSTCLALCPILSIETRKEIINEFQKRLKIDIHDSSILERVDLIKSGALTQRLRSRIYIYSNISSEVDRIQMNCLGDALNHKIVETQNHLTFFGKNLIIHTVKLEGRNPHTMQPNMHVCKIIYDMIEAETPYSLFSSVCESLYSIISEGYKSQSKIKELTESIDSLKSEQVK